MEIEGVYYRKDSGVDIERHISVEAQREEQEKDVKTIRIIPEMIEGVNIGLSSIIGTRESQQDCAYGFGEGNRAIAVVCDGMGGLSGGEVASRAALESVFHAWMENPEITDIPTFLQEQARIADSVVYNQKTPEGERLNAGTNIVMVTICQGRLHWLSVGDSRIYILRGQEILTVNRPHNYQAVLDERLANGEISEEEYAQEEHRAAALTSYLGMGNVKLMDINREPFIMESKDILLLCSDGLYRSLSDREIMQIIMEYREDIQEAAEQLTRQALGEKVSGQDNTTAVLLEYYKQSVVK